MASPGIVFDSKPYSKWTRAEKQQRLHQLEQYWLSQFPPVAANLTEAINEYKAAGGRM